MADVYGSTEEIKARGQVIVGLMHEDIGHLGIFVSGKVAKKEHAQIVSVLKSIEALPPGPVRHGDRGAARAAAANRPTTSASSSCGSRTSPARLNRYKREDEKPFEAVNAVSEFNQRAYELFGRPLVQALRQRIRREAGAPVPPAALAALGGLRPESVAVVAGAGRAGGEGPAPALPAGPSGAAGRVDRVGASPALRSMPGGRCAMRVGRSQPSSRSTATCSPFYRRDQRRPATRQRQPVNPRELPFVKQALAAIDQGGYAEALARVAFLMAHQDEPLPLSRLHLAHDLLEDYRELLPELPPDEVRRIAGEQEIIARHEPERAIATLPVLLGKRKDRDRLLTLLDRVLADRRVQRIQPTAEQNAMLARIRSVLGRAGRRPAPATARRRLASVVTTRAA